MPTSVTEVEDILKRLHSHDGVVGVIVVNNAGVPINSTFDNPTSVQYTGLMQYLTGVLKTGIKKFDPTNDLTYLRLCTRKHEICVILVMNSQWIGLNPLETSCLDDATEVND